jgi:hypothetical protein
VGRVARLLLAGALGWTAYDLWLDRAEVFARTDPLTDPFLWILVALVVHAVYDIASLADWGKRALIALALVAVGSAGVAVAAEGTLWTGPLTWLVWGLALGGMVGVVVLLLVAVGLGTPGCEGAVVRSLVRRRRGEPDDERVMFCLAGLHSIDAWERSQPWRRER